MGLDSFTTKLSYHPKRGAHITVPKNWSIRSAFCLSSAHTFTAMHIEQDHQLTDPAHYEVLAPDDLTALSCYQQ